MVEAEEQARTIVRFAKYPPEGVRGAAFGFAHDNPSALCGKAVQRAAYRLDLAMSGLSKMTSLPVRNASYVGWGPP